jgi:type IV secretory pathway TraG/TraD family ATPase VirD4
MLPMKTQRARWFDDPNFTSRVRMPPEIPRLDVTVATDDGRTAVMARTKASLPSITAADVEPEMDEEAEP